MYNKEKNWVSNLPISYLGAVAHQEETDPGTHRLAGIIQVTEAIQVAEEVPEAGTTQRPVVEAVETVETVSISCRLMNGRRVPDSHPITGLTPN